ncbi:hypothetical protein BGX31_003355 [Mortierella sp. GBA43]|nr:hypothetical protein BGX31_003355 [Mortierella sp. GBA43]
MDAHVKIEDDPNRTATTTSSSATAGRTTTSSQKSSSSSSNGTGGSTSNNNNNNKAEFFGKKGQGAGGSRRSGTGDPHRKSELYKTELCISVSSGIPCKYGDNCQFAHSEEELNQVTRHPRYKTQMCTSFQNQGYCKYNDRCTFIHHPEEARVPPPLTPTRRGSVPERSSWTPLGTTSNNSPAASASESRGERLRSLSDPGQAIVCSDKTERSIKGQEVIHSVIGAPSVLSQVQHVTPITTAVTAGATAGVPASEAELLGCMNEALAPTLTPAMRRPQRRMTINQPSLSSDPITSIAGSGGVGAGVGRYHQVPGYSPSLGFNTGSDVSLFGHTNTTNATHTITRLGLARRSSSAVHFPLWQDRSSPWRDNVEVDDDEQWASKLAYYISTPHNDFRI